MPVELLEAQESPQDVFDLDVREIGATGPAGPAEVQFNTAVWQCGDGGSTEVTCTLSVGCCC